MKTLLETSRSFQHHNTETNAKSILNSAKKRNNRILFDDDENQISAIDQPTRLSYKDNTITYYNLTPLKN